MGLEIERKYLINPDLFLEEVQLLKEQGVETPNVYVTQGYLSLEPCIRVLIHQRGVHKRPLGAWVTVKGPGGLTRAEYEFGIQEADISEAVELMTSPLRKGKLVSKIRHYMDIETKDGIACWEVDQFTEELTGLWVAELELDDPHQPVRLPEWILKEVTGDPRYANMNLAQTGKVPLP